MAQHRTHSVLDSQSATHFARVLAISLCVGRRQMYLRLSVHEKDNISGVGRGLFTAMGILNDENVLLDHEAELYAETLRWFAKNLLVPKVLSGSNHHNRPGAISWFKDTATEHIRRMRQLAQILEAHGISVTQHATTRPGSIEYEDEYQIAAIPFRDTFPSAT